MNKELIVAGLVAALAIPTAAVAAGHGSATKAKAKGAGPRSGLAIATRPSKNMPASSTTKVAAKPKARTRSGRKPKATGSAGKARTSLRAKRNKTAGTPGVGVTLTQGGVSAASGKQGVGGLAVPAIGAPTG